MSPRINKPCALTWALPILAGAAIAYATFYFGQGRYSRFDAAGHIRARPPVIWREGLLLRCALGSVACAAAWGLLSLTVSQKKREPVGKTAARIALCFLPVLIVPPCMAMAWRVWGVAPVPMSLAVFVVTCAATVALLVRTYGFRKALPEWLTGRGSIVLLAMAAFLLMFHGQLRALYNGGITYGDTGMFAELVWNTLHGKFMQSTWYAQWGMSNFFGEHLTPVLLLFVPAFSVLPRAEVLLAAQSAGLALGAIAIYEIARHVSDRRGGLACALAYLLHPSVYNLSYVYGFGFKPVVLSVPALLCAYWFALKRWRVAFTAAVLLALMCKESATLGVLGLGGILAFGMKRKRDGILVFSLGAIWLAGALLVVIPTFRGGAYRFFRAYNGAASMADVVHGLAVSPWEWGSRLVGFTSLSFLSKLLMPLGFLPLLRPRFFLGAGIPLVVLLLMDQQSAASASIQHHMHAVVLPGLFMAWLAALAPSGWMAGRGGRSLKRRAVPAAFLVASAAISHWYYGASVFGRAYEPFRYRKTTFLDSIHDVKRMIPADAVLISTMKPGVYFFRQRELWVVWHDRPMPWDRADFALLHGVLPDTKAIARCLTSTNYRLDYYRDGLFLFARYGRANKQSAPPVLRVTDGRYTSYKSRALVRRMFGNWRGALADYKLARSLLSSRQQWYRDRLQTGRGRAVHALRNDPDFWRFVVADRGRVVRDVDCEGEIGNLQMAIVSCHEALGEIDKAYQMARDTLKLFPSSVPILNRTGVLCMRLGRVGEGITFFRRAHKEDPKKPEALRNLGAALFQAGKYDEAETHLKSYLSLVPDAQDSEAVRRMLGLIQRKVPRESNPRD